MEVVLSDSVKLDAQAVITGRGCVIGQSGSGKSFLAGVIAEELAKTGMPFCIVDTEGEYASLKNSFSTIVVGGENADIGLGVDYLKLFSASIDNSIGIVLDVSEVSDKAGTVYAALNALYEIESSVRKPYLVIIEEADKFAPQVVSKKINIIEEIAFRGRKRGLGLFIATQRPANISKNVLAQCSYGFIGKLTIDNDVNAIRILFSSRKKLTEITTLGTGEFIPFGIGPTERFRVRGRVTKPMGYTPAIAGSGTARVKLNSIIQSLGRSPHAEAAGTITGKKPAKGNLSIELLQGKFGVKYAEQYADKMRKRKFVVFGEVVEGIDSVEERYLQLAMCHLRFPTRRSNEYLEYYTIVDGEGRLVRLNNAVRFIDSSLEESYKEGLLKGAVGTESASVQKEQIIGNGITRKKAESYIRDFYPTAIIAEFSIVYMPIYRISLRAGNRVRVFSLNGIDGKTITV